MQELRYAWQWGMVSFVTNGYEGGHSSCYLTEIFSKRIFSCNYIKVELRTQRCLCMYMSFTFVKHCYDLQTFFKCKLHPIASLRDVCLTSADIILEIE